MAAATASGAGDAFPQLPPSSQRILEHDWCSASSYARARQVGGLTQLARQNLSAAEHVALTHPRGCRRAERSARANAEQEIHRAKCLRGALPLGPGARVAAAAAAAAFEGRAMRPVIVGYGSRLGEVRHLCGRASARRTVTVGMIVTALLPSASLSDRELAVSHIRGHGWQVWMELH